MDLEAFASLLKDLGVKLADVKATITNLDMERRLCRISGDNGTSDGTTRRDIKSMLRVF